MNPTHLLVMFAITFGLMNKLPKRAYFLPGPDGLPSGEERPDLLGRLLRCSYCVGFHAGWMTWLLVTLAAEPMVLTGIVPALASILLYALTGATACYALDVATGALERHAR